MLLLILWLWLPWWLLLMLLLLHSICLPPINILRRQLICRLSHPELSILGNVSPINDYDIGG